MMRVRRRMIAREASDEDKKRVNRVIVRQKIGAVILRDRRGERASNANKVSDHVNWKDGSSPAG